MVAPRSQSRRVDDRYDLLQPLGRGGMGVVWLAEDSVLQRKVAVKEVEFPPGVPVEEIESLRARVMREARTAGRLNHPNVTTIFDVVRDEGRTWIVMEYVDAPTLTDLVSQRGPLSPQRAAEVGLGVLAALEAAHAAGIVHRDVKPGNVMVPDTGNVKLADFGVAAVQGDPKLTMTGLIIGSPSFMAPEQAQEGVTTPASDMWGLGATLYYAVEGAAPFDKGAAIPTLSAVAYEAPRPMERAGELQGVIDRLLAKQPDQRPTAGELGMLLREVAGAAGDPPANVRTAMLDDLPQVVLTPELVRDHDEPVAQEPQPVYDDYAEEEWPDAGEYHERRRSAWPWVIAAAVLLLLAALALPGLLSSNTPPNDEVAQDDTGAEEDTGVDPDEPAQPAQEEAADGSGAGEQPAEQDEAAEEPPAGEPAAGDPAGASVPADWTTYEVADTGTSVAHPDDWSTEARSSTATDLIDPGGGRYLRIDYTETPGDDAVADWERQSESFDASHDNYSEIAITEYEYPGADTAGLWEYTYSEGGADLHAYNLAIVIGGRGYALNFQTREDQWDESQQLWEQFVAGFEPAQ